MSEKKIVLLFGSCPLPVERAGISIGTGGRTWQFARPLIDEGFRVLLFSQREDNSDEQLHEREGAVISQPLDNLTIYRFSEKSFHNAKIISDALKDFDLSEVCAVVGAGSLLPNVMGKRFIELSDKSLPLWADFYGDYICEIQSKIEGERTPEKDNELFHVWRLTTEVLLKADKFSTVSKPQLYGLLGQLSIAGRMNPRTNNYDFATVIPCGIDEIIIKNQNEKIQELKKNPTAIREKHNIPNDAFVIYWSGSFNTWIDVKTLFYGIEKAMEREAKIHLLVSGGGIKRYFESFYNNFINMVNQSKQKHRFHLKGWLPEIEIPELLSIADLGINVDRKTYEGIFGSRNRILHFSTAGIPVLTTILTDLTKELIENNLIFDFELENPESLAEKAIYLSNHREKLIENSLKAKGYILDKFNLNRTMIPLLKWISNPQKAPDNLSIIKSRADKIASLNPVASYIDYNNVQKLITELEEKLKKDNTLKFKIIKKNLEKVKNMFFKTDK